MISEVLHEVWREIAEAPLTYALELVQFAILVLIVWVAAVGVRGRRGILVSALQRRSERLTARLDRAAGAEEDLERSREDAAEKVAHAADEASSLIARAEADAEKLTAEKTAEADADAATALRRADEAIAREAAEMDAALRTELVDVVATAAKSLLASHVSPAEQRELIEHTLLEMTGECPANQDRQKTGPDPS